MIKVIPILCSLTGNISFWNVVPDIGVHFGECDIATMLQVNC